MDSINKSICKNNLDFKIQSQIFFYCIVFYCCVILYIEVSKKEKYQKNHRSQFNFVKKNIKFALIFDFIIIINLFIFFDQLQK